MGGNACQSSDDRWFYHIHVFHYKDGRYSWIWLCSMFTFANVLGAILLLRWNKNGLGLIAISAILFSIVYVFILHIGIYSFLPFVGAVIFLWLILQIRKKEKSAWSQLDKGWDYKHCRHIYQIFAVVELILFILTLIAFGSNQEKLPNIEPMPVVKDSVVIDRQMPIEKQEKKINLAADSVKPELSRTKQTNDMTTQESTSSQAHSLEYAAKYLDTHTVWLESEMSRYPELRNLNKELYRRFKTGRFRMHGKICSASKKLKRIEMYFTELERLCDREGLHPHEIRRFLHLKIDPTHVRPDEIIMSLREAIERTKMYRKKRNNSTEYNNKMDSIQNDERARRKRIQKEIDEYKKMVSDSIRNTTPTFGLG